jgi:hypothetical protein
MLLSLLFTNLNFYRNSLQYKKSLSRTQKHSRQILPPKGKGSISNKEDVKSPRLSHGICNALSILVINLNLDFVAK